MSGGHAVFDQQMHGEFGSQGLTVAETRLKKPLRTDVGNDVYVRRETSDVYSLFLIASSLTCIRQRTYVNALQVCGHWHAVQYQ
jgi:hypothetical protein